MKVVLSHLSSLKTQTRLASGQPASYLIYPCRLFGVGHKLKREREEFDTDRSYPHHIQDLTLYNTPPANRGEFTTCPPSFVSTSTSFRHNKAGRKYHETNKIIALNALYI
jgi:hypothetical protein